MHVIEGVGMRLEAIRLQQYELDATVHSCCPLSGGQAWVK